MTTAARTWKVLDILKVTESAFAGKGIANPRLNAELLLSDITGDSRMNLYLNFEKPLTESEVSAYRDKVKRRLNREPLQYILGKTEFFGLKFTLTPDVLIPRQETELLVELVLEYIKTKKIVKPAILEIGTGSGCIPVSIAANTECTIDAIDISEEALKIAELNAENNNTASKIRFIHKDFLKEYDSFDNYDIIVSNPPYIAEADFAGLSEEVRIYEPLAALSDSKDGLSFYRKIFELCARSDFSSEIFTEIGDGKKDAIEALLNDYNITGYSIHNDLIKIPRVLNIKRKDRQF